MVDEVGGYAIGPAEANLRRIFSTAADRAYLNVIFFEHQPGSRVRRIDRGYPTIRDLLREILMPILTQAADGDPLKGSPAVRQIPLLSAPHECCSEPPGGKAAAMAKAEILYSVSAHALTN